MINLNRSELISIALKKEKARLTETGAIAVRTGRCTGRSPNAKYIVEDSISKNEIDWDNNQKMSYESWKSYRSDFMMRGGLSRCGYSQTVRAGRDPTCFLDLEIHTSQAWQSLFVRNMFLPVGKKDFKPDFKIYCVPEFSSSPKVIICLEDKEVIITGTNYAGEIKKSVFTIMNFYYPTRKHLPMHCSVNADLKGKNPAIFFGLSGTGKTTLSADSSRILLGDDEHGWTNTGLCNFENGCYAKVINLNENEEPEIWNAVNRFGSILENVVIANGIANFEDNTYAENTRASYPIEFINNSDPNGYIAEHPKNIIMLTCDAFGILPPVSKLNTEDAVNTFLLGYTAKVAGTEKGVVEPEATFSPCFGLPFMPRSPKVYGKLLKEKIQKHGSQCWLVNTGWTGGGYGVGSRIPISVTRDIVRGILDGSMVDHTFETHEYTQLSIPTNTSFIPDNIMFPELGWKDQEEYKKQANILLDKFEKKKHEK